MVVSEEDSLPEADFCDRRVELQRLHLLTDEGLE